MVDVIFVMVGWEIKKIIPGNPYVTQAGANVMLT